LRIKSINTGRDAGITEREVIKRATQRFGAKRYWRSQDDVYIRMFSRKKLTIFYCVWLTREHAA